MKIIKHFFCKLIIYDQTSWKIEKYDFLSHLEIVIEVTKEILRQYLIQTR